MGLFWEERMYFLQCWFYSPTAGYSSSILSPRSDQSNRNFASELGLSGSDFDEDSALSGEVSFNDFKDNDNDEPDVLASTAQAKEKQSQGKGLSSRTGWENPC